MKLINTLFILSCLALTSSKAVVENNDNILSFNLESGFYDDEIELEIKASDPNARIYYTLDGSDPTEESTLYKSPFTLKNKNNEENILSNHLGIAPYRNFTPPVKVKKGNVVRALAKLPNGELSKVVSGTYFIGIDKEKSFPNVPVFNIITDPDNLFDYEKGIYIMGKDYDEWVAEDPERASAPDYEVIGNYSKTGKMGERQATIEYYPSNNHTIAFSQDIGLRLKGKCTRTYYQKSFHLTAREEYGNKNFKYDLIPGNMRADGKGPITKYKSFNLRNGGNDSEYAKFRDMVLQGLVKNEFFETQQSDFAVVFVDGEYWGIYDIYEEYDEHYLANNYDIDKDNAIIIKNDKVESGVDEDMKIFNDFVDLITKTDLSRSKNYAKISKQFDVEGYAWYAALYTYIDVQDGWFQGGNWGMWRTRESDKAVSKADGKWRMMAFDTEFSSGIYGKCKEYTNNILNDAYNSTNSVSDKIGSKITVSLLKNKEFKNMFVNALSDIRNIHFELGRAKELIDKYENTLVPLVEDHIKRNGPDWALEYPEPCFKDQVKKLRNWLEGRHSIFLEKIQETFGFKSAVKVTVTSNNFKKGSIIINNMNEINKKYSGEYFRENILYITGKANKGRKLKMWKVNGCKIASNKKNTIGVYPKKKGCTVTAVFK